MTESRLLYFPKRYKVGDFVYLTVNSDDVHVARKITASLQIVWVCSFGLLPGMV